MTLDLPLPWLRVLVGLPAVLAVASAALAARKPGLAGAIARTGAVATLAATAALALWGPLPSSTVTWIPALGASIALEASSLTAALALMAALGAAAAILPPGSERPGAALGLLAAWLGVLFATDALLLLACAGAAMLVATTFGAAGRTRWRLAGVSLVLWLGWAAYGYGTTYAQSGLYSTDLARWRTLVLDPSEALGLYILGAMAVLLLVPSTGPSGASRPAALLLPATTGLLASALMARAVVPLSPGGATAAAGWTVGVVLAVVAAFVLRGGWAALFLGYQTYFLLGLFTFRVEGIVGGALVLLGSAPAFAVLRLGPPSWLRGLVVLVIVSIALGGVVPSLFATRPLMALLSVGLVLLLGLRVFSMAKGGATSERPRGDIAILAVLLIWTLALPLGWSVWSRALAAAAEGLVGPPPLEAAP